MISFYDSDIFIYGVLPLLIFFARIIDVSIGTLRIVFISKGKKIVAPILGFFEVLIWIIAISKIMQDASNIVCYIAYASGFAVGNYVGLVIEEKLAYGVMVVRIITQKDANNLKDHLTEKGFGITMLDAEGSNGKVNVLFTTIKRQDLNNVVTIIKKFNPKAFYSVEDVKFVNEGVFPLSGRMFRKNQFAANKTSRKGK